MKAYIVSTPDIPIVCVAKSYKAAVNYLFNHHWINPKDEIKLSFADSIKMTGTSYSGVSAGVTLHFDDRPTENHYMTDRVILKYDQEESSDEPFWWSCWWWNYIFLK